MKMILEEERWQYHIYGSELEKTRKFKEDHNKLHGSRSGAIGGRFTYCFTPTTLGTVVKISCSCGTEEDVTDYESW